MTFGNHTGGILNLDLGTSSQSPFGAPSNGILGLQPKQPAGPVIGGGDFAGAFTPPPTNNFTYPDQFAQEEGFHLDESILPNDFMSRGAMVKVTKMLIFKTGQYRDQYLRPITAAANINVENVFSELTNDGQMLDTQSMSRVASTFIAPRADVHQSNLVNIEHGWSTPRMRFIMMVEDKSVGSSGTRYIIQGFMDHSEHISHGNNFNPRAKLYFSRAIQMTTLQFSQGGVMNTQFRVNSAADMLSNVFYNQSQNTQYHHMRPQDIFSVLGTIKNSMHNVQVRDLRTQVQRRSKMSSIANNNMSMFLSTAMNAARDTILNDHGVNSIGRGAIPREENIRGILADPTPAMMQPINIMQDQTRWTTEGFIEWQELASIFPEINHESVTKVQTYKNAKQVLPDQSMSENFNTAWQEGVLATVISQELPPIMLDLSLTRVSISVDGFNFDSVTRRPIFIISALEGFDPSSITPQLTEQFKNMVMALLYPRITQNGAVPVKFSVDINIMGDCRINIATSSSGPFIPFVVPQFAENTILSLVTPNQGDLGQIARAINTMTNVVEQQVQNQFGAGFQY